jgi:hypothetical protein
LGQGGGKRHRQHYKKNCDCFQGKPPVTTVNRIHPLK